MECINYKSINKGSLQGFADFSIPKMGIKIFGCKLFMKDGRRWISMPSRDYEDENGEKKYFEVIHFLSKEHKQAFNKRAIELVDQFCQQQDNQDRQENQCEDVPF